MASGRIIELEVFELLACTYILAGRLEAVDCYNHAISYNGLSLSVYSCQTEKRIDTRLMALSTFANGRYV